MARNPPWEFDELVLALDVYLRVPEARQSKNHPEIAALSKALRALPLGIPRPEPETFRNVNSAFLKLQNIKALDPSYTGVGLTAGATRREQALWDRYINRPDALRELAQSIRAGASTGDLPEQPVDDEDGVVEGRIVWRWHRQRERAASKVVEKKAKVRHANGELVCEVCDLREFDVRSTYGVDNGDVFECHHTTPLHKLSGTTKTTTSDLAVVCPTCHRALHRSDPPPLPAQLRAIVGGAGSTTAT